MTKTYYYAVEKDGQGWYYDNPPIFDGESWNVDPKYDMYDPYTRRWFISMPEIRHGKMSL